MSIGMRDLIIYGLENSFDRVIRCVDDVTDDEATAGPQGLSPIVWQLGHLVVRDSRYLQLAGGAVALPAEYERLFDMGTGGPGGYPSLAEVRRHFEGLQPGLIQAARTTDLGRPVDGRSYHTAGEVLVFTGYHRGYHIGKMTTLRALLKKPRLFG